MPASPKDDEAQGKTGSPEPEVEVVGEDDEGFVEVTEDGSPIQDREVTSSAEEGDEPDDDADDAASTDADRAKLEKKRKNAAQRESAKLKRQLAAMEKELAEIRQHQSSIREAEVERLRGTIESRVSAAEQALETAYEDGDAKGIVAAQRVLREAQSEADRWEGEAKARPAARSASEPASNPLVEQFVDKHGEWFNPRGGDVDSDIVRRLSAEIAREGTPANTKAHFDELEERMAEYLPSRVKPKAKPRQPAKASAAAPSVGRANNGARPGTIAIPKATIAGFKELGIDWDDPDPEARKAAQAKIRARVIEARRNREGSAA